MSPRKTGTTNKLKTLDQTKKTALTALGDDPYREDADVKKLTGPSGLYRLRVGSYRVAYQINDGELVILVVKVGDRRDVYRNL